MTGIICAMDSEAELLLKNAEISGRETIAGVEYVSGNLCGKDVVIAICGMGKVNAAVCTQNMINKFSPDLIINTGIAGSLTTRIHCGDIAIGTSVIQHDYDTTAIGDIKGFIQGPDKINFPCDKQIVARLKEICEAEDIKCRGGVIATGDQFIADKKKAQGIVNWFGAIACDMEAGAIGHTCYLNGVRFAVIRCMSDEADGSSGMTYYELKPFASQRAADLIMKLLGDAE